MNNVSLFVDVSANNTNLGYTGGITNGQDEGWFSDSRTINCEIGDLIITTDANHEPQVIGAQYIGWQYDLGNTIRCRVYKATSTSVTINPTGWTTAGRIYRY